MWVFKGRAGGGRAQAAAALDNNSCMLELAWGHVGLITACCIALHSPSRLRPLPPAQPAPTPPTCSLKPCAPAEQLRLDIDARRREQQALDDAWWAGWLGLTVGLARSCSWTSGCRHITCRPAQLPTLPCPAAALPCCPPRAKHNEEQARAAEAAAKAAEKKKKKMQKPGADAEQAVAAPAAEAAGAPEGGAAAGGDPAPWGEDVAAAAGTGSSGISGGQ